MLMNNIYTEINYNGSCYQIKENMRAIKAPNTLKYCMKYESHSKSSHFILLQNYLLFI